MLTLSDTAPIMGGDLFVEAFAHRASASA